MQAHVEVALDGLNVGLFSVLFLMELWLNFFRAMVVETSRLNRPMQEILFSVDNKCSVLFKISCLIFSAP